MKKKYRELLEKFLAKNEDGLKKMSRPRLQFPNLNVPTRLDQEIKPIGTERQKDIHARAVAETATRTAPQLQRIVDPKRRQAVTESARKDVVKQIKGSFGRGGTMGHIVNVANKQYGAALVGKEYSKYDPALKEAAKEKEAAKMAEYENKRDKWKQELQSKPKGSTDYWNHLGSSPKRPRKSPIPKTDTKKLSSEAQIARGKAQDMITEHEAAHMGFGHIRNKYPEKYQGIMRYLMDSFSPEVRNALITATAKRYNPRSPHFYEEVINHARDILTDQRMRNNYFEATRAILPGDQQKISGIKQGWKEVVKRAKKLTPEFGKSELNKAPKERLSGITTGKLKQLTEDHYHNPDTGLELVPEAVHQEIARRAENKAPKMIADYKRKLKPQKPSGESPEDWFGKRLEKAPIEYSPAEHGISTHPIKSPNESWTQIHEQQLPNGLIYKQFKRDDAFQHHIVDPATNKSVSTLHTRAVGHPDYSRPQEHAITWAQTDPSQKGKGLGKQAYLATLVHGKGITKLHSGTELSLKGHKAWLGLKNTPGLKVNIAPYATDDVAQIDPETYNRAASQAHAMKIENPKELDHGKMFPQVDLGETKLAASEEAVVGGKGDRKKDSDFNPKQVKMGHKVEMEHTSSPKIAAEITRDHLTENPRYYSKLKQAGLADELKKGAILDLQSDIINELELLEKAEPPPTYLGEISWNGKKQAIHIKGKKGNILVWDMHPKLKQNEDNKIVTNTENWINWQPKQHHELLRSFTKKVLSDPYTHLRYGSNFEGGPNVARARHVNALATNSKSTILNIHDPNSLSFYVDRHGEGGGISHFHFDMKNNVVNHEKLSYNGMDETYTDRWGNKFKHFRENGGGIRPLGKGEDTLESSNGLLQRSGRFEKTESAGIRNLSKFLRHDIVSRNDWARGDGRGYGAPRDNGAFLSMMFEDPWDQAKHDREHLDEDSLFEDPWDQAKHDREHLDEGDLTKAEPSSSPKGVIAASQNLNKKTDPNLNSASTLFRHYKHSPHHPLSVGLKYLVHRIENKKAYKSATPEQVNKMDSDFLKLHQSGGASTKNGHLTTKDLQDFYSTHGKKLIPQLNWHKKQLRNSIINHFSNAVVNINGKPHIALTRGLNTNKPMSDHALASYADRAETGFGDVMHHRFVPLDNVWYSYELGNKSATSKKFGNEFEYLVSPHQIIPASKSDIKQITGSHGIYHQYKTSHEKLVNDENWPVRLEMARNPNLHPQFHEKLVNDKHGDVRLEMAQRSDLHPQFHEKFVNDENWPVRRAIAKNPNLHPQFHEKLVNDENWPVRLEMARRSDLHPQFHEKLVNDEHGDVCKAMAERSDLHPSLHEKFVNDKEDSFVRRAMARRPDLHPSLHEKLVNDEHGDVRLEMARNPNLHPQFHEKLVNDENWLVRRAIARNPNLHPQFHEKLVNDKHGDVRLEMAQRSDLHPQFHEKFVNDKHVGVRLEMARNPNLHPQFHEKLVNDEYWDVRKAMAKNPNLHPQFHEKLVNDEHWLVRLEMARNPNYIGKEKLAASEIFQVELLNKSQMNSKKYFLKHQPPAGKGAYGLHTVTAHDHLGNVVGELSAEDLGDGTFQANMVEVHPEHRRKGIAGAMYDYLESKTGLKAVPDLEAQTEDARKFWINRKKLKKGVKQTGKEGHHVVSVADNLDWHFKNPDAWKTITDIPKEVHREYHAQKMMGKKPSKKILNQISQARAKMHSLYGASPVKTYTPKERAQYQMKMKKTEEIFNSLQKASASKKLLGLLGLAAATTVPVMQPSLKPNFSPKQEYVSNQPAKKEVDLRSIAEVESRGGKDTRHKVVRTGMNAGSAAVGSYGLMPLTIKDIVSKDPKLKNKYAPILRHTDSQLHSFMLKNPNFEKEVASAHYDNLNRTFKGNLNHIAYAWLNGKQGAINAIKSGKPIDNHWHVKKVKNARDKILGLDPLNNKKIKKPIP